MGSISAYLAVHSHGYKYDQDAQHGDAEIDEGYFSFIHGRGEKTANKNWVP